jgi:GNAT superfamily N-acetyltransferase
VIIERLSKQHIEDAAKIIALNYRQELRFVPSLPNRDFYNYFYDSINEMTNCQFGVAAIQNNKLIGFLSGLPINAFKGLNRGIYCDIYAHGAAGDKKDVYQRLYEHISEIWVRNGCLTHAISIFAHEKETVETWFHLGFGNRCVDAMRPLTDVTGVKSSPYEIRIATENDAERLLDIDREHHHYNSHAPLFMPVFDITTIDDVRGSLTLKDHFSWIALDNEKPVAKMNIRKGGEYPFIAEDEKTINVCGAYALPEVRGTGVSANLLKEIVQWAKAKGYERLGVDYESFNRLGSRFWEKHFTSFAYCMFRKMDERILWANFGRNNGIVI